MNVGQLKRVLEDYDDSVEVMIQALPVWGSDVCLVPLTESELVTETVGKKQHRQYSVTYTALCAGMPEYYRADGEFAALVIDARDI